MRWPGRSAILGLAFLAAVLALSSVNAVPIFRNHSKVVESEFAADGKGPLSSGARAGRAGRIVGGGSRVLAGKTGLECRAGRNGGATDTGVTATKIKLGATVVRSGIGSFFLGGAPTSMQAVAVRTNNNGGICGRLLDLEMIDDRWQATQGVIALRSLIDKGVFALAVSPSSEGVHTLVEAGDLNRDRVPLVGADGLVKSVYKSPYAYPVASSTVSTMHIIAQEAYRRGARTFGVVYEKDYKFGVEGAFAFNAAVKRLTGRAIPGYNPRLSTCRETFCGLLSGQPSYSSEVEEFNSSCDRDNPRSGYNKPPAAAGTRPSCDYVALLLEPKTALTWLTKNGGAAPRSRTMGPQPLFSSDFAKQCDRTCEGMEVWTSYNPPISPYVNQAAVASYVQTVRVFDRSIDASNSFTQGAYIGMKVLVEALQRIGPDVTRVRLRQALDSGSYDFGLGPPVSWRPGNHLGSGKMQSFQMQYQGNTFIAFTLKSRYVTDRFLGKDL